MLPLLSVITYLDRICIAVAGPAMQADLGISPSAWGWVTGIFFLCAGMWLWLKVDASRQLFAEETPPFRAAEVVT